MDNSVQFIPFGRWSVCECVKITAFDHCRRSATTAILTINRRLIGFDSFVNPFDVTLCELVTVFFVNMCHLLFYVAEGRLVYKDGTVRLQLYH